MEPGVIDGKVEILSESECRALLARQPVGRVGYITDDGKPMIVPVDFIVVDDLVVFRSGPGEKLSQLPMRQVCFEADGQSVERVWSVVVHGLARDVTTALDERYERLRKVRLPTFPQLRDPHWVAIGIQQITGRRLSR